MSEAEKAPYYERAKEGTSGTNCQPKRSWKEASTLIKNMESNVCFCFKNLDVVLLHTILSVIHIIFVGMQANTHYIGVYQTTLCNYRLVGLISARLKWFISFAMVVTTTVVVQDLEENT